ncbi:MAG: hypothetical protein ACK56I_26900, partial [bacterium]
MFRFVSVRTENYFCLFRGHPSFTVPAGTVVLISSASHLAAVGTAAYAEDLVRAFRAIRAVYETGITVMHGIPLL